MQIVELSREAKYPVFDCSSGQVLIERGGPIGLLSVQMQDKTGKF
jgi:hypothetical protein